MGDALDTLNPGSILCRILGGSLKVFETVWQHAVLENGSWMQSFKGHIPHAITARTGGPWKQ